MGGYTLDVKVGRVQAGEWDQVFTPTAPWTGCILILLHGSGAPRAAIDPVAQPATVKLAATLAAAGIPTIAGDFGGQTWANDTSMSRIDAAWALGKTLFPTARTDKMLLLGGSMGGAIGARYVQLHPTRVAAFCGLIPLWDLVAFYNANVAGSQAEIAAAWGVSTGAALPAGANVAVNVGAGRSVPHLCGYSTADATVLNTWTLPYAAAVGAPTVITDTVAGHSDAAIGGMPLPTVGRFFAKYGG